MLPEPRIAFPLNSIVFSFWPGMMMGVSAVATPVKFRVQDLARQTALVVGRMTSILFCRIEIAISLLVVVCAIYIQAPAIS